MHVFLEVEENVADYFDAEFWDDEFKEKHNKKDIDPDAKEIEFWDWKDMADDDYVAAHDKIDELNKKCEGGREACKD